VIPNACPPPANEHREMKLVISYQQTAISPSAFTGDLRLKTLNS